jgi:hypothetical protein
MGLFLKWWQSSLQSLTVLKDERSEEEKKCFQRIFMKKRAWGSSAGSQTLLSFLLAHAPQVNDWGLHDPPIRRQQHPTDCFDRRANEKRNCPTTPRNSHWLLAFFLVHRLFPTARDELSSPTQEPWILWSVLGDEAHAVGKVSVPSISWTGISLKRKIDPSSLDKK